MSSTPSTYGTGTNVSVGTTPIQIPGSKSGTRSVLVFNNSTTATLYTGFTNAVSSANGMPILPGGGEEFQDYTGAVWAVASTGTIDVRVQAVG